MSKVPPQGIQTPPHVLDSSMDCVGFFHGEALREWRSAVALCAGTLTRRRMVLQRQRSGVLRAAVSKQSMNIHWANESLDWSETFDDMDGGDWVEHFSIFEPDDEMWE